MSRVAQFMPVSAVRFQEDWMETFERVPVPEPPRMPRRATAGSAGYDFFSPLDFCLEPGKSLRIPTGIRAHIDEGWVLMLFPRSGLGFRHQVRLSNTVGIIDADYYNNPGNEGAIAVKIRNEGDRTLTIPKGEAF